MPRSGPSNIYTLPPIYLAVPGTPIIVDQHNTPLEDIADTFNEAWPVNFGGTGGTSPITAWDAINARGADIATAGTIDLTLATGPNLHLTGTATVTTVSLADGAMRFVTADAAFQLTASATLVVNGSTTASYITSPGDLLVFLGNAASVTRVWSLGATSGALFGYTTTATAGGTTTLTASSGYQQYFTGASTQTVVMPVTSTLSLGRSWRIVNNSTGPLTINSSGGNTILFVYPDSEAIITCILLTGTTAASWSYRSASQPLGNIYLVTGSHIENTSGNLTLAWNSGALVLGGIAVDLVLDLSAANAGQVAFPANQNPSADANTLDDYEEGTWSPTMTFNASSTGVTYSTQLGYYVKIGQFVDAYGRVTLTSNGTGVGAARITSVPFSSLSTTTTHPGTMRVGTGASAATGIKPVMNSNATTVDLVIPGATADITATDTNVTDTFSADFAVDYRAAA